jgi:hypothetical protein
MDMEKTEMMKKYDAETDEIATWCWHDREFLTDDYIAWLEAKANISDEAIEAFRELIRNQCDEISALKAKVAELEKENDRLKGIVHNLDHTLITNGVWSKV